MVYYFHGATQSETTWSVKRLDFYTHWESRGLDAPTVVAISLGRFWILSEKAGNAKGGLLDLFMEQMLPQLERALGNRNGRRILVGESMGGFNASQLMLKYPSYWDRVALLCPAFMTIPPYATATEVADYTRRNRASRMYVSAAIQMFRSYFADNASWLRSTPLEASPGVLSGVTPQILVACGSNDEFGFYEGAKKFSEIAQATHTDTEWHSTTGRHCSYPVKEVARFIAE